MENRIKALIVDDEEHARNVLRTLLNKHCPQVHVVSEASGFIAAYDFLKSFDVDLVFLDVQMPDGSGFKLLEELGQKRFSVIFTTAFDQYAIRAIRFSALDYLLKPIVPQELVSAVERALELASKTDEGKAMAVLTENVRNAEEEKRVVINTSEGMHVVKVRDVVRCESDDYYTRIHLKEGKPIMVSKVLKEYEELFKPMGFIRVHKSHLVNIAYVKTFVRRGGDHLVLMNGEKVPVSRRRKDIVLAELSK